MIKNKFRIGIIFAAILLTAIVFTPAVSAATVNDKSDITTSIKFNKVRTKIRP